MPVMRPVLCGATNIVDPNTPLQGLESGGEDNTMQKILRSPVTMKKKINSKTFGVPLKELARGPTGVRVPVFIKKICEFIQMHGIGHEGIFRINGSTRVVDKMKAMIDKMGDADLEEAGDVMAVASLLKLFLRELPDPIMTEALHLKFINTQLANQSNPDDCIKQLKALLQQLPEEHYIVLRYLIRFLVMVSQYENTNKMNSMALAIVFGPNLFRCSAGLDGLREQGITNIIVRMLIDDYEAIFKNEEKEEISPPPAQPPGSKCIQVQSTTSKKSPPVKPMPYQDYIRQKEAKKKKDSDEQRDYNSNSYTDTNREEMKKVEDCRDCDSPAGGLLSPRDVGVEERAFSPFNLDSETGTSTAPSPVINDITSELVEKTIQETVSEHLFGQSPSPDREETLTTPSPEVPVPSPRRRWQKRQEQDRENKDTNNGVDSPDGQSTSSVEEICPSIQDRIRSFSSSAPDNKSPESSPKVKRKHQPSSKAFEVFETQGIVIGPGPSEVFVTKKKQSTSSAIPLIIDDPRRDQTNSCSPLSRKKAPEPPTRPSRGKAHLLKSKGQEKRPQESGSPGSVSGSPRSKSPRSYSPRSNSPRSISPKSNSPRSNSPKTYSPNSDSPKSRSPRSKSPKSQSPKPMSVRNNRLSVKDGSSCQPSGNPQDSEIHADFDSLPCNSPTLKSLTAGRIAPPKNRRSPSNRRSKIPQSEPTRRNVTGARPYTEPLSIIIPGSEPMAEGLGLPQEAPQPKPRRKHSGVEAVSMGAEPSQGLSGELETLMNGGQDAAKSPPKSPQRREHAVPPLNLTSLHEHADGEEPIPAWKARHHFHDNNQEAMLSPRSLKLQTITHVSHDTDVPPSPPSSQPILTCVSKRTDKLPEETDTMSIKQLTKQIRTLKRKIRQYEEEFEDQHGYKPSHLHKTSQPQIKKMMGELKKASKQLKEAKENAAKAKVPLSNTLPAKMISRNLTKQFEEATTLTNMEIALREAETRLQEKRDEADRPEDILIMNKEQVQEEKTAIQKALLQMENKFGRPSTKETKELMKPLYDRYRNVKKLLVKLELRQPEDGQSSSLDLQTIKEHEETKEFQPKQMGQFHNLYTEAEEAEEEEMPATDLAVTQEIRGVLSNMDLEDSYPSPADSRRSSSGGREEPTPASDVTSNLHEASLSELLAMQNQSREDKKRLRKMLKEFEDNFFKESGRTVQKEDRVPMETQYNEYKHVKKHLKLLEALVAKHRVQASSLPEELVLADL
ncbi:protein FAM13A-like isoform X2 [Acanthaster planci]|uniref:Protein FAM13A-like isoform X2 n=1 Tax=Acanthaster planci TaxID=133434 RepID=A0A8B7XKX8_ACAPL|nr:protein FAM13A-like isoform X2 [Acanthaster planci]